MAAQQKVYYASGSRKTSKSRVFMKPGTGKITINGLEFEKYLQTANNRMVVLQPLQLVDQKGKVDMMITVTGGGVTGQAGAIRHGVARALLALNPDFRPSLKKAGLLTRDSRMVERKKYGKHGARRSTQFSKR